MQLDKKLALRALSLLDEKIVAARLPYVRITVGGGGALLLAHNFPGKTNDVDGITTNIKFEEIKGLAEAVGKELKIDHDWLNPYFSAFTFYLPSDAKNRLSVIYNGKGLIVEALGAEDILIMKLMAGRAKDRAHIKHLITGGADLSIVENRLQELKEGKTYSSQAADALDLLDEEMDE